MLRLAAAAALILGVASPVAGSSFWYANMDHTGGARGYAPDLDNYNYQVFKTVSSGDGNAIQQAIYDDNGGKRHPQWLASQPRVVYLPPGTYEVSNTITMNTDTVIMGDAINPPIIKASRNFNGDTLFNGKDNAVGDSGELSFAVSLKNVILDTTNVDAGRAFTGLYWGVAQVAHLQNVKIVMPSSVGDRGHSGIRLGRGSTLTVADVRVERGLNGILHDGHQQANYKGIYFYQNTVGMRITGGNTISIIGATFDTVGTGVLNTGGSPYIGLIDCTSINSGTTFITTVYPSFLIENLNKDTNSDIANVPANGRQDGGRVLKGQSHVDTFTYGNTVGRPGGTYGDTTTKTPRPAALAPGGKYPINPAPTYANNPASDFINVKDPNQNGGRKVLGDHTIDESGTLNDILALAASTNKIAYFPFGKYRVDSTLFIPPGSRIVGEGWATITGSGSFFQDENNPKPVVSVGREGNVGVAQIQDMRFTVSDICPGAIIVQFNMAGNQPGDVALWNSLITIGGTKGANGITDHCYDSSNQCKAAFIGMHFSKSSSAYVENIWNWVADHQTEGGGGANIAVKGGALVESTKGTWLHGLGSEHFWLYQLNLRNAENVMVSMLQAETNYDQGDKSRQTAPAPWKADVGRWGDPDFSWCGGGDTRCRMGFANYIQGGANIFHYATAAWAFFGGNRQGCAGDFECQNTMNWISQTPNTLQVFGMCSKSATNILRTGNNQYIRAQPNFTGGWQPGGGDIGRYTA